ncbi:MAG: RNA polymerase sigma factor [Nitratireductor sp.]
MNETPPVSAAVRQEIAAIARNDWGRLVASLIGLLGDFQLAEDSLQDALESALRHWTRNSVPQNPPGWLLLTARRKAIDRIRRSRNFERKSGEYARLIDLDHETADSEIMPEIPDERLALIFTCCHPALEAKSRIALTLRTLGGLATGEIARSFLDTETAMAQRLVRAQRKIRDAAIPFAVPERSLWPERLDSVLSVLYLVFSEGYAASEGDDRLRHDLCTEAIRLARILDSLIPDEPEVEGLLALMILHDSRKAARLGNDAIPVSLAEQDRSLWDREAISNGLALVIRALSRGRPGPYQLQAAISAIHSEASSHDETGWQEIVLLYDQLHAMKPNPIVLLNRAVALSCLAGAETGLANLAGLEAELEDYQPYHAAKADMLSRAGKINEASIAYDKAIQLSQNRPDRLFLEKKKRKMQAG